MTRSCRPLVLVPAILLVLAGGTRVFAWEKAPLDPPVYLPDGQQFKTWEVPLEFSRTYYVDQAHPRASDDNPGTQSRPFRTIGRAAAVLQPGQRVVIAAGTYRERVQPARGGDSPQRMISYEAAPGATVVLSGSRVLEAKWVASGREHKPGPAKLWMTKLPEGLFAGENPFAQLNLTDQQIDRCMTWAVPTKGKVPNTLRRGLIFQDGRRLRQGTIRDDWAAAKSSYWVGPDGLTIHLHPAEDADPNRAKIEVTVQGDVFAPKTFGLGFIRVKGLTIEHAAGGFPRPQEGALSTRRGHHWIIEDNTVRECNAIGVDIGDQFDTAGPRLAEGGQHIVRRNTIGECGIGGIEGKGVEHTLIEDNVISCCGWQRAELIYETGGVKLHGTRSTLVRRNLVQDSIAGPGIWLDYLNRNSRCTQNVVVRTEVLHGAIFMEGSQAANLVDHNIVWGSTHSGIYQHDCDELVIAHNLVAQCQGAGIRMQTCPGRKVGGRLSTAKRNQILNNILVDNAEPLAISDPENTCDGNLFGPCKGFDLAAWQQKHGWDKHSTVAEVRASLDPQTVVLTWSARGKLPQCGAVPGMTGDFWGRPYSRPTVLPGPFGAVPDSPCRVPLRPGKRFLDGIRG